MRIFGTHIEKSDSYTSISGEELTAILRDMGFVPELAATSDGEPLVKFNVGGFRCLVLFYGLEKEKAKSLQFCAMFAERPSLDKVNEWNRKKRYGKAYLDKDGDVVLAMDKELEGGILRDNLVEVIKTWRSILVSFAAHMAG